MGVHQPSLRLDATPLQPLPSFGDVPEGNNDRDVPENPCPRVNALTVHDDFVIYAFFENLGTDASRTNAFSMPWRGFWPSSEVVVSGGVIFLMGFGHHLIRPG